MAGKRGQNEGSIYKRPDGRWCAQVNLGYVNGKRKRKYLYGDTRAEVAKQMTTILRDVQHGMPVATERLTVGAFLDRWLEDAVKPSVRPSTYADYETTVRLHLKPALARIGLTRLTAQDVQKMMNEAGRAGVSVATIRHMRLILSIALGRAMKWRLVAINAASLVEAPRAEHREIEPLTPAQTRQLLDAIRGDRLEALCIVAVAIGLRRGEALGLTWDCIDLDAATLTVRHQLQRIDGRSPKSSRRRRAAAGRSRYRPWSWTPFVGTRFVNGMSDCSPVLGGTIAVSFSRRAKGLRWMDGASRDTSPNIRARRTATCALPRPAAWMRDVAAHAGRQPAGDHGNARSFADRRDREHLCARRRDDQTGDGGDDGCRALNGNIVRFRPGGCQRGCQTPPQIAGAFPVFPAIARDSPRLNDDAPPIEDRGRGSHLP